MQIVIEIPDEEIPKHQGIIDISLSFVDGKVTDAHGYGFCQLPEHHGDLKDINELKKNIYRMNDSATLSTWDVVIEKDLDDALTILEATEEK